MTKQTWTAVVSAICFAACALVALVAPIPFVIWAPGQATDLLAQDSAEVVMISENTPTYPTSGSLLLATTAQTPPQAKVTLVDALYSYWAANRQVLPRDAVYPAGATVNSVSERARADFETSALDASAAGLRTAGIEVTPVPVVASVNANGPAQGRLQVHDIVLEIGYAGDGAPTTVQTAKNASEVIASGKPGDQLTFSIVRDGVAKNVTVTAEEAKSNAGLTVAGVSFIQGYRYAPQITYDVDPSVGDAAGLMLALATYDKVTPDSLLADRVVAGAGAIGANGLVTRVNGVRERITAAERAGASVFLLPTDNCADVEGATPTVRLVPVGSLKEAVSALEALADPAKENTVKGCHG